MLSGLHDVGVEVGCGSFHKLSAVSPQELAQPLLDRTNNRISKTYISTFLAQTKLLLWKRAILWRKSSVTNTVLFVAPLALVAVSMNLIHRYSVTHCVSSKLIPAVFWFSMHQNVHNMMYDKANGLQESMRMMGLLDSAYSVSVFVR